MFRIRIQLNLDLVPAKNCNLDPEDPLNPDPDPNYFLTLSDKNIYGNYVIIIPFYHQMKIERYNVVKSKIILC